MHSHLISEMRQKSPTILSRSPPFQQHCMFLTRRDVMVYVGVGPLRPAHPGDVPDGDGGVGDGVAGRGVADNALHAAVGLGEREKYYFFIV